MKNSNWKLRKILMAILINVSLLACNSSSAHKAKISDMKKNDKTAINKLQLNSKPWNPNSTYQLYLSTENKVIEEGKLVSFQLQINAEAKKNVPLEVAHEQKIHLIIVNDALSWFHHIHPQEQADGSFAISEQFPASGKYWLFADYKPSGGDQMVSKMAIEVVGSEKLMISLPEEKSFADADGYQVTLLNSKNIKTNQSIFLDLSISKEGKLLEANDLEPYLGAIAHIILISNDDKQMLHVHPTSTANALIHAETYISTPGKYRMWVQFKADGQVHTADFTFKANQNDNKVPENQHQHQH